MLVAPCEPPEQQRDSARYNPIAQLFAWQKHTDTQRLLKRFRRQCNRTVRWIAELPTDNWAFRTRVLKAHADFYPFFDAGSTCDVKRLHEQGSHT